ncbi:MAG: hypothetical protein Q8Q23_03070 [bacterium]|nr:hypothetical protein [bacterium]
MEYLEMLSATFEVIGTVMIAFAALRVHHRFLNEHKVDNIVLREMRRERIVGITGVFFLLIGYGLHLILFAWFFNLK